LSESGGANTADTDWQLSSTIAAIVLRSRGGFTLIFTTSVIVRGTLDSLQYGHHGAMGLTLVASALNTLRKLNGALLAALRWALCGGVALYIDARSAFIGLWRVDHVEPRTILMPLRL